MLEINNLTYKTNNITILDNINLQVNKADFITIFGANGSGKTTLLKILLGIKKNWTGEIIFNHKNIKIGYVPQIKTFDKNFPATSIELVINGITGKWSFNLKKEHKIKALELLNKLGLESFAEKRISNLSGGELQRIYFARAIVNNPDLLLLDEPATGIDNYNEENIYAMLKQLNTKYMTTILMVTHNIELAKKYSSIIYNIK